MNCRRNRPQPCNFVYCMLNSFFLQLLSKTNLHSKLCEIIIIHQFSAFRGNDTFRCWRVNQTDNLRLNHSLYFSSTEIESVTLIFFCLCPLNLRSAERISTYPHLLSYVLKVNKAHQLFAFSRISPFFFLSFLYYVMLLNTIMLIVVTLHMRSSSLMMMQLRLPLFNSCFFCFLKIFLKYLHDQFSQSFYFFIDCFVLGLLWNKICRFKTSYIVNYCERQTFLEYTSNWKRNCIANAALMSTAACFIVGSLGDKWDFCVSHWYHYIFSSFISYF